MLKTWNHSDSKIEEINENQANECKIKKFKN